MSAAAPVSGASEGAPRHLVLVGLPGSGKSTVGPIVAVTLGTWFVDTDSLVMSRVGRSIPEIFRSGGEEAFRDAERVAVEESVRRGDPGVIAPGGGWAAQPGNLDSVTPRALTVYLETGPDTAAQRIRDEGKADRPLLAGVDLEGRIGELLAARQPFYQRCEVAVATEGWPAEDVAVRVVELARTCAGW
jgi:shikimate kinase